MNRAIDWFARNRVAANLLMAVIFGAGAVTLLFGIRQEVFPEFSLDRIVITVPYPGAAPEEVEDGVTIRVEESIQGLDGIKRITSTSSEGVGVVAAELLTGADGREVLDDIKARIDAIRTFPLEAEEPVIQEITNRQQVISIAVHGKTSERSVKQIGQRVRDEIAALPGISVVELVGVRPYEVSIEVSEQALRRHGLTIDAVAAAVRAFSLDLPGGSVRTRDGEVLLRTEAQAYVAEDFASIPLLTAPDGTRLLVGDVARVVDGFAETDQGSTFDGDVSAMIQVYRIGDQDALQISGAVQEYAATASSRLTEGVSLSVWQDNARVLRGRRDLLLKNAAWGFALVFGILALFMRFRLAMWITIGIFISFFGALWLMPTFDVSINLISLFAFILVLGIVVDDAVIVGENIYSHQQRKGRGVEAAISGAQEVATPVIFAVLTTIAAFAPLLGVTGTTGKIITVIPIVVILTLVFSLIESLFVLPAHLSHGHGKRESDRGAASRGWRRFQNFFSETLEAFIEKVYRPFLEVALAWRYLTVAVAVATLLITVGAAGAGLIKFVYFPQVEADYLTATLSMPRGTTVETTRAALRQIETAAERVAREVEERGLGVVYRHTLSSVGDRPMSRARARNSGEQPPGQSQGHIGEVAIELVPSEERGISSTELVQLWRRETGSVPGASELTFSGSLFSPGAPIDIQLTGEETETLVAAAEALKEELRGFPGVFDVTDSFEPGKQELELELRPSAELVGLTRRDLARQVRQAFYGEEVQRIQREKDEVKVFVRYPESQRGQIDSLATMRIRTADGREVPFSAVAETTAGRGFASIERVDRRRAINIRADVDTTEGNANDILAALTGGFLEDLVARYPGMQYTLEGQGREQAETLVSLAKGFGIALLLIYALMAVPFRSYVQPLIVMLAIPFGLVGAVWGHMIMRLDLTILSMFGLVALAGVVVNDSLVLVDFINRRKLAGDSLFRAVRDAGAARFRPVILTSLTTFAGLTPLLLERSVQAQFLIPMAVSLGFGIVFSTVISLVIVPCGYTILEDLAHVIAGEPTGARVRGAGARGGGAASDARERPPASATI